jgi:hypothetical protein
MKSQVEPRPIGEGSASGGGVTPWMCFGQGHRVVKIMGGTCWAVLGGWRGAPLPFQRPNPAHLAVAGLWLLTVEGAGSACAGEQDRLGG